MWQRWWPHFRSMIADNPMLHADFMALSFIIPELMLIQVLHCGNRDFHTFLLLWPSPRFSDLRIRTWPIFPQDVHTHRKWTFYFKAFESCRITDRRTYVCYRNYVPRCFAGGEKFASSLFDCQDLPLGLMDDIDRWCHGCLQVINEVDDVLTENRIWRLRTVDIGTVSAEDAINLGFRLCAVFVYMLKWYLVKRLTSSIVKVSK